MFVTLRAALHCLNIAAIPNPYFVFVMLNNAFHQATVCYICAVTGMWWGWCEGCTCTAGWSAVTLPEFELLWKFC